MGQDHACMPACTHMHAGVRASTRPGAGLGLQRPPSASASAPLLPLPATNCRLRSWFARRGGADQRRPRVPRLPQRRGEAQRPRHLPAERVFRSCAVSVPPVTTTAPASEAEAYKSRLGGPPLHDSSTATSATRPASNHGWPQAQEETRKALDSEGWFHSGDVGELSPNGSLRIVDRKKNIFKLSQGAPRVSPALDLSPALCVTARQTRSAALCRFRIALLSAEVLLLGGYCAGEYIAVEKIEGVLLQSPLVDQARAAARARWWAMSTPLSTVPAGCRTLLKLCATRHLAAPTRAHACIPLCRLQLCAAVGAQLPL